MKINKDNYEAYLLDLYEGTCSAEDEALLRQFIQDHPELNIELDFDLPRMNPDLKAFEDKLTINRSTANPELSIQELIIAVLEGDASKEEQIELIELCQKSSLVAKEKAHLERCYLHANAVQFAPKETLRDNLGDELTIEETNWAANHEGDHHNLEIDRKYFLGVPKVIYPHKADLKKREKVVAMWWYSAAAVAAMFVFAAFIFQRNPGSGSARALAEFAGKKNLDLPIKSNQDETSLKPQELFQMASLKEVEGLPKQATAENRIIPRVQIDVPAMMSSRAAKLTFDQGDVSPNVVLVAQDFPKESIPTNTTDNALAANDDTKGSSGFMNLKEFLGIKLKERLELPKNSSTNETVLALATQARQSLNKSTRDQTPLLKNKKTDNSRAISLQIGRFSYERN